MAKLFDKSGTRLNSKHVNMFGDGGERQGAGQAPRDRRGEARPPAGEEGGQARAQLGAAGR